MAVLSIDSGFVIEPVSPGPDNFLGSATVEIEVVDDNYVLEFVPYYEGRVSAILGDGPRYSTINEPVSVTIVSDSINNELPVRSLNEIWDWGDGNQTLVTIFVFDEGAKLVIVPMLGDQFPSISSQAEYNSIMADVDRSSIRMLSSFSTTAGELGVVVDEEVVNEVPVSSLTELETSTVGDSVNITIDASFDDPDGANTAMTFDVSGLPDGVLYEGGVLTGTPTTSGVFTVSVIATDEGGASIIDDFTWTVEGDPEFVRAVAEELFEARGGKVAFLSELSLAAYHLDTENGHEAIGDAINVFKRPAEEAYEGLPDELRLLDSSDVPSLTFATDNSEKFRDGFANGIYTNANSAALVARSEDALFIAFRGTNDNGPGRSEDVRDWNPIGVKEHYNQFSPLFSAVESYMADHPEITKMYFTGHSLGAAMVEAAMRDGVLETSIVTPEAVTFASPGYPGLTIHADETFISNYRIYGDAVPWENKLPLIDVSGDVTLIKHNLLAEFAMNGEGSFGDLHSMRLYRDFIQFFEDQGVKGTSQNGRDYETIFAHGEVIDLDAELYLIGQSADTIIGSGNDDIILGGGGKDLLYGKGGFDFIKGGAGADLIRGGASGDYIEGGGKGDTLHGGAGKDEIFGNKGFDSLYGGKGKDTLYGGKGEDDLYGGGYSDTLSGGAKKDEIWGGKGADTIYGNNGNDIIYGGKGKDIMSGGRGHDTFVFETVKETNSKYSRSETDVIKDWDVHGKQDTIDLSGIDAKTGFGNQEFSFIGEFEFNEVKGELRVESLADITIIQGDKNGDGVADFEIILSGQHTLQTDDFIL